MSACSICTVHRKDSDLSLKMSLEDRTKRVKRRGEHEIIYNMCKFMKHES